MRTRVVDPKFNIRRSPFSWNVLKENWISQLSRIGARTGVRITYPSPRKLFVSSVLIEQSCPPKPSGHSQMKLPQPSLHFPRFWQGKEWQNPLFSRHPARVPLFATKSFISTSSLSIESWLMQPEKEDVAVGKAEGSGGSPPICRGPVKSKNLKQDCIRSSHRRSRWRVVELEQ